MKASAQTALRGNNPFILAVGGVVVTVISGLSLGLLVGPASVGLARASLRMVRGEEAELEDLKAGLQCFAPAFVAGLLVWLPTALGLAALVVPGVIVAFFFTYTFHIVAENPDTTGVQAVKDSFAVVKAHPAPTVVFWVVVLAVVGLFSLIPVVGRFLGPMVGVAIAFVLAAQFFPGVEHVAPEPPSPGSAGPGV